MGNVDKLSKFDTIFRNSYGDSGSEGALSPLRHSEDLNNHDGNNLSLMSSNVTV